MRRREGRKMREEGKRRKEAEVCYIYSHLFRQIPKSVELQITFVGARLIPRYGL